jgi:hypothetical protein
MELRDGTSTHHSTTTVDTVCEIAETMTWLPQHVTMPFFSSSQAAIAAARDLAAALNNPAPASPIYPLTNSQREQLHQLADIFTHHTANTPGRRANTRNDQRNTADTIATQFTTPHHLAGQRRTTSEGSTPTSRQHCPNSPSQRRGTHINISEGVCSPCSTSEGDTAARRLSHIHQSNMGAHHHGRTASSAHIRPRNNQCRPRTEKNSSHKAQTKSNTHEICTEQSLPSKCH